MTALNRNRTSGSDGRGTHVKHSAPAPGARRLQRGSLAGVGSALKSSVTLLCSLAALAAATAIIDPTTIRAAMDAPQSRSGGSLAHHEFARTLANLINGSHEVLAISAAPGARTEIVLWLRDAGNPGVIDAGEVALISHSPLFQTVTLYARVESVAKQPAPSTAKPAPADAPALRRAQIAEAGFCERWRARSDIAPRVLGAGISDLRLEEVPGGPSDLSLLRLALRWTGDSSDGAGDASALLKVAAATPRSVPQAKPDATNDFRQE